MTRSSGVNGRNVKYAILIAREKQTVAFTIAFLKRHVCHRLNCAVFRALFKMFGIFSGVGPFSRVMIVGVHFFLCFWVAPIVLASRIAE